MPDTYILRCADCRKTYRDDGYILGCKAQHGPSFLISDYKVKFTERRQGVKYMYEPSLFPIIRKHRPSSPSFWSYRAWLPVTGREGFIPCSCDPYVYKSRRLAAKLGLKNLWIVFNGYWPEKKAFFPTGTFKDLEAIAAMQRACDFGYIPLVLASDGNTGRAFSYISACTGLEVYIVIPEDARERLWLPGSKRDYKHLDAVHLIVLQGVDYYEAIKVAGELASHPGLASEGGAKNIARRDGMGKALLAASIKIGNNPDHYFQAVGSAPGAIAAFEQSRLLNKYNGYTKKTRIHVSQNDTFCPVVSAWGRRSPIIEETDIPKDWKRRVGTHYANVLVNRHPAYEIRGGIYDCLKASGGSAYAVPREEAERAMRLFEEEEGIDIVEPSAVCVASLIMAVRKGTVKKEDTILVNITGGGISNCRKKSFRIEPELFVKKGVKDKAKKIVKLLQLDSMDTALSSAL